MRQDPKERRQPDVALCREVERLESWKAIANYVNRTVRTTQRWEKNEGLPVHRHLHAKQGTIYAFTDELDAWLLKRSTGPRSGRLWIALPATPIVVLAAVLSGAFAAWLYANSSTDEGWIDSGFPDTASSYTPVPKQSSSEWVEPDAYQEFKIGMDHLSRRNYVAAIAAFDRSTSLDPRFARSRGALVLTRTLQSGQVMDRVTYAAVRDDVTEVLRKYPALAEAHAAVGILALEEGRAIEAEASLRVAIEIDPELAEARYWLVVALEEQRQYAEADGELRAALAVDPLHPQINDMLAMRYRARGDYDSAQQRYLAMLELEAPPIGPFHGLVELNTEFGRLDEALYWAQQIALRKPVYDGLDTMISTYARLEMNSEAKRWRRHLAIVEPQNEPRLGANCKYLYMQRRVEECYELKVKYLARSGQPIEEFPFAVRETFGGMAVLTGRYEEGVSILEPLFRPALRIPKHLGGSEMAVRYAQYLAYAYQRTGRAHDATSLLGEINHYLENLRARNGGARPRILVAEARNLALLGRKEQALAAFSKAVQSGWRDYVYERPHPAWKSLSDNAKYRALMGSVEQDVAAQRRALQSRARDAEFEVAVLEAIEHTRAVSH